MANLKRLKSLYKPKGVSTIHDPPSYDNLLERLGMSSTLLVRHAKSISNIGGSKLHVESNQSENGIPLARWLQVFANEELIDTKLCDEGIEQCLLAGKHLDNTDVRAIIVSPMRRTIETAYYTFRDH